MDSLHKRYPTTAAKGRSGEQWMFEELKRQYHTVTDYTRDMNMQRRGIDFSIQHPKWQREYYLDVKNNLYIDHNNPHDTSILLELSKANGIPGWFITSQADRIYHVNSYLGRYVFYDLAQMRRWVMYELSQSRLTIFKTGDSSELIKVKLLDCPFTNGW
jgi:hypothetical protein